MPFRDGTGPLKLGLGFGRGSGRRGCETGIGGECICPNCGQKISH